MSQSSTGLSKHEKKIARYQRSERGPAPLLVSRADAAAMLGGVSTATMIRMEQRGLLRAVRLSGHAKLGAVFYPLDELERLARGGGDHEA